MNRATPKQPERLFSYSYGKEREREKRASVEARKIEVELTELNWKFIE